MLWNQTSRMGSRVYYHCVEGYFPASGKDYTVCGENGLWEDNDLQCEGEPLLFPRVNTVGTL